MRSIKWFFQLMKALELAETSYRTKNNTFINYVLNTFHCAFAAYQAILNEQCFELLGEESGPSCHGQTKRTLYAAKAHQKGTINKLQTISGR